MGGRAAGGRIDDGRGRRGGGAGAAGGRRQSASGPRPRGRRVGVRRAAVSPRAPGGGGEPRAARPPPRAPPRAHARARSAPPHRAGPARARTLSQPHHEPGPAPRLRPVFLWARQLEGTVQEVLCEDYDPRNRIRIARTRNGWRVIPRTEIYDSFRVPPPPPPPPRERRRRRRSARSKRRRAVERPANPWLARDLESHIPSHTIAVPRPPPPEPRPPPPEPTPLDNLLAVAELEFNQQRGSDLLELEPDGSQYDFLPEEQVASEVMSFELGVSKTEDMFFDRKSHAPVDRSDESGFQSEVVDHKDLFETISEAHYLPELGGPHDEALLESLVEKGCEDNQILGQALDKLAHLVHGSGDYAEEEDDMLLGNAPVSDIIDRLEQSLESPGQSSITAAQSLLHLHNITEHLPHPDHQQAVDQAYMSDEVFTPPAPTERTMETLNPHVEASDSDHAQYDNGSKKGYVKGIEPTSIIYAEPVPDTHEAYEKRLDEQHAQPLPDQSEMANPSDTPNHSVSDEVCEKSDVSNDPVENVHSVVSIPTVDFKELEDMSSGEELVPTDLSIKHTDQNINPMVIASVTETMNAIEDNISEKSDEQPKDLSVHRRLPTPHASPRRIDLPRAPSRESDAMQSPQPSGIPAVPSSPEIFTMPPTKSKHTLFLETLLSSPSPKMYTSEVTITKQQCEPLNLGKHRKSASPTVSSCSDEIKKLNKEFGEPQEKKIKKEVPLKEDDDLVKITKVFGKCSNEHISECKEKKPEKLTHKSREEASPLKQLHVLKTSPDFNIPDPLLVPKDRLNVILAAPGKEIPALLIQRPELRLPEAFAYPAILQDPDILVISLSQLENILENNERKTNPSPKPKESKEPKETTKAVSTTTKSTTSITSTSASSETARGRETPQSNQKSQPKPIPSMDALAGDIDAATSAALNQMLWLPYLSQLEAMAACSQNMDFLKALNSSGYSGANYPDLSQMFNHPGRFMGPGGFPMMPPMDYDNRLQFAMWQEAMKHANASASQRSNSSNLEAQMKELERAERASKQSDVQNPYVHSTKNPQNKPHSSARTSPIAHNYNSNQRSMAHNPFLQGMYPGMNPNMRPNMPLPGLQIPYFNPNMMGSQRSPRTGQQKSPTSPYYPNNNYLHSVKQSEGHGHQRSNSTSSQESPRPRISVKSLQNLLEPTAAAASGVGRSSNPLPAMGRRRDEPEVGSTTPLGEPPPHLPPHPHDPSSFHLWHPLFGNQKGYASPWNWTQVTATGD